MTKDRPNRADRGREVTRIEAFDDAAFAFNLGLGVVPDEVATIPADVRKAL